ncbi:MAG: glycosyltransferase family 4 protein [Candidatus Hodarchaeota archaeon]
MKVCYVSSILNIHDLRFLSSLVNRNYEVYLVTYFPGELPRNILNMSKLHIIHKHQKSLKSIQKFPALPYPLHLKNLLKKIKPDILHTGYVWKDGFLGALSGFHPHLLMPWGSDILITPNKSIILRILTKYTISNADMITCDCQFVKNRIIDLSGYPDHRIITFPWGIELDKFRPKKKGGSKIKRMLGWQKKKVLIMNRNLEPVYGITYFLDALRTIVQEIPGVRVLMIGSGSLEQEVRSYITANKLTDNIHLTGKISIDEMPDYLRASDAYISPSLSDGTSVSLLEAIACGLPVVVTDLPAIREWVKDGINGFLVPEKDPDILAEKTIQLLKDDRIRGEMGQNNIKLAADRADWNKNFSILEDIYRNLVN